MCFCAALESMYLQENERLTAQKANETGGRLQALAERNTQDIFLGQQNLLIC